MSKNVNWERVGELKKTKRNDMLKGKIFLKELGYEIEVFAFLSTKMQKKKNSDPDIVILHKREEEKENIFT